MWGINVNFSLWLNVNVKEKIQTSNPYFWKISNLWTCTRVKPCWIHYLITYFQRLSVVGKQNAGSMLATWALRGERSEQFTSKHWIINLMCLLSSEVPSQIGPSVLALLVQCSPGRRRRERCWRDREPGGEGCGLWSWAVGGPSHVTGVCRAGKVKMSSDTVSGGAVLVITGRRILPRSLEHIQTTSEWAISEIWVTESGYALSARLCVTFLGKWGLWDLLPHEFDFVDLVISTEKTPTVNSC